MHAEDDMPPDTARPAPAPTPAPKPAEPPPVPAPAAPHRPHEFAYTPPEHERGPLIWPWVILVLAIVAGGGYWWYTHHHKEAATATGPGGAGGGRGGGAGRVTPVVTVTVTRGDLPIYLTGLGTVTPLNNVTVRSRVDGQIDSIAFEEGQFVKRGDLLIQIDPRPFQVQLAQAEGQYAKDQASLKNAQVELDRYKQAADAIPKQQIDTQQATVDQFAAAVKIDQGQIDTAQLQLTYARITAPISGRIGLRGVDIGNIIHANDATGLALITQLQPISVVFTLPQDVIPQVMKRLSAGPSPEVEAFDRDLRNKLATGTLLAIDNQVDPASGTIRIKAQFPNEHLVLFPNQFVNARLLVDTLKGATLVPNAAIQRGPDSMTYVYVVNHGKDKEGKDEDTVEVRNVTTGPSEAEQTVIETGLQPGEVVVTDGVDKLQPDAKVSVRRPGGPGGPGAATRPSSRPTTPGHNAGSASDRSAAPDSSENPRPANRPRRGTPQ
jgi:membrane fusion protein, multidrug efflux system